MYKRKVRKENAIKSVLTLSHGFDKKHDQLLVTTINKEKTKIAKYVWISPIQCFSRL